MTDIPIYALLPFVLMLGAIACFPLFAEHIWKSNRIKLIVALILALPVAIWLLASGLSHELLHTMIFDYVPFIILLGSLYVITGGIFIEGDIEAKPFVNTIFLAISAVLASLMGTTGAAMLLIRPILSTNQERKFKAHTILFFIAIGANCGGLLTPLGDPPLFMMYLRGVPFLWFAGLIKEWLFVNGVLLILYFFVDSYFYKKEPLINKLYDKFNIKKIKIYGGLNFIWLMGVILAVALINPNTLSFIKNGQLSSYIRELVIVAMAFLSLIFTQKKLRKLNEFSWEPMLEVAYLFLGIFVTMIPCLLYLKINSGSFGINLPYQYYYATGAISSVLDNAPSALAFHSLALGLVNKMPLLLTGSNIVGGIPEIFMQAICLGAVFFGAMTYIGNGPNFLVKAIAESHGVKMPGFFGYMLKFSLIVLLPLFVLVQIIFL